VCPSVNHSVCLLHYDDMILTNGELLYDVVMFLVAVYLPDAVMKQRAMLTIAFQNLFSLPVCIFFKIGCK
jgi:hypothetical protein